MKTRRDNLHIAFREVFARTGYIVLASVLALIAFAFAVLLPNFELIFGLLNNSSAPFVTKISIVVSLLGGIVTNFSLLSAGYTIAIAVLFGINIAMIVHLVRKRRRLGKKTVAVGVGGFISGLFGVGCASCGAFLLTAILSSFGAMGLLVYLPLRGGELGVLGVILLIISLALISKKISEPLMCKT